MVYVMRGHFLHPHQYYPASVQYLTFILYRGASAVGIPITHVESGI